MHTLITGLRLWLAAVGARPAIEDPLERLSLRERADLPASHPAR